MSAIKNIIDELTVKLIAHQKLEDTFANYDLINGMIIEGVIAPLDYAGNLWERDGRVFNSTDEGLIA